MDTKSIQESLRKPADKINMVDLTRQYQRDKAEFDQAMAEVVDSTAFINGPTVKKFCGNLEQYLGVEHVIPCANGTDALQIALMALGLEQGDEVITVPFTFVATVEVIALLGYKPIFVDVNPVTFNMDPASIESKITARTKAIVPVHLYGQSCDMDPIMEIANKHGLKVVEDTAQATGAEYTGKDGKTVRAGTIGHIGTTSFYPTKNLGAWGDGGALFTRDAELAAKIRLIANHGSNRKYYYDSIGVNSRLDGLQAAILDVKLARLDAYNERRREAAAFYDKELGNIESVTIPVRAAYARHVFHQYTIKVADVRDDLRQGLSELGIPTMIYYPVPLHLSGAYRSYGYSEGDFPVSEELSGEVLSLPMHSELDNEQLQYITEAIRGLLYHQG